MKPQEIISKEEEMMLSIRKFVPQIVALRLDAIQKEQWIQKQNDELTSASEEMAEAIEALYHAETAMGNVHQSLLVSQATLKIGSGIKL